jgi:hypothetical protein
MRVDIVELVISVNSVLNDEDYTNINTWTMDLIITVIRILLKAIKTYLQMYDKYC